VLAHTNSSRLDHIGPSGLGGLGSAGLGRLSAAGERHLCPDPRNQLGRAKIFRPLSPGPDELCRQAPLDFPPG
jgi:hypothetical protein